MEVKPEFARSESEFSSLLSEVESVIDLTRRLPALPFRAEAGLVEVCQYDEILTQDFAALLCALCDVHGDQSVALVTIEPDPLAYYRKYYGQLPGFRLTREALSEHYWKHLSYLPNGNALGAILYTANVVALVGSTRTWSVWGQRTWDMGLVHSAARQRPWLDRHVPLFSPAEGLSLFREAPGSRPLTDAERSVFLTEVDEMARRTSG
jgi:hypothetical protein